MATITSRRVITRRMEKVYKKIRCKQWWPLGRFSKFVQWKVAVLNISSNSFWFHRSGKPGKHLKKRNNMTWIDVHPSLVQKNQWLQSRMKSDGAFVASTSLPGSKVGILPQC